MRDPTSQGCCDFPAVRAQLPRSEFRCRRARAVAARQLRGLVRRRNKRHGRQVDLGVERLIAVPLGRFGLEEGQKALMKPTVQRRVAGLLNLIEQDDRIRDESLRAGADRHGGLGIRPGLARSTLCAMRRGIVSIDLAAKLRDIAGPSRAAEELVPK
jgi:hypothetical protein